MWRFACFLALALCWPAVAAAQAGPEPVPPFAVDIRGFLASPGRDPVTAGELGLATSELPGRALGGAATLNLYPFRRTSFAVGLTGEFMLARARQTPEPDEVAMTPAGPPIEQRLESLSAGLSLNFGHRHGWSYLSAAMGPMRFGTFVGETPPAEPAPRKSTINLGGGARWFVNNHLGVTFDLRFYLTRPELPTPTYPGRQRNRLLVLSGGISIR